MAGRGRGAAGQHAAPRRGRRHVPRPRRRDPPEPGRLHRGPGVRGEAEAALVTDKVAAACCRCKGRGSSSRRSTGGLEAVLGAGSSRSRRRPPLGPRRPLLARPDSAEAARRRRRRRRAEAGRGLSAGLPGDPARVAVWRTAAGAVAPVAARRSGVAAVSDLAGRSPRPTSSPPPRWRPSRSAGRVVHPGTHLDLIGAYRGDMREADDALVAGGSLFVDSRETTIGHIGELAIPIARGVIAPRRRAGRPLRSRRRAARTAAADRDHRLQERWRCPPRSDDRALHRRQAVAA